MRFSVKRHINIKLTVLIYSHIDCKFVIIIANLNVSPDWYKSNGYFMNFDQFIR